MWVWPGLAVAAEGDELDVAHAGLFDATAGNDSLAIGQQEDLKHDPGVIGTGADFIVVELGVYGREIEFVID